MPTTVRISWDRSTEHTIIWNEALIWAIEMFDPPGPRFRTHANENSLDFIFKDKNDALMMAIKWEAPIVDDNQLTVETVSRLFEPADF